MRALPTSASPQPLVMPQGVRRFQCIGGACEYTCCSDWTVTVDSAHYKAIKARMGCQRASRDEFKAAMIRDKAGAAVMQLRSNGDCPFLAEDRFCSLQRRFGESSLPDTCAVYPRSLGIVGSRREMFGTLSCPEMARLCLLADDGMALVESSELGTQRHEICRTFPAAPTPYERYLDVVRSTAVDVLSRRQYSISSRLFFLAYLGKRTEAFFHRDATAVDEERLLAEIRRVQTPAILDDLDRGFRTLAVPGQVAANIVLGILKARTDPKRAPAKILRPLVTRVLDALGAEHNTTERDEIFGGTAASFWARYQEQRTIWETSFSDRVNLIFENHAKNFWLQEWYTSSPNLLAHAQSYLCRAAVARFLVFGHPALQAVVALEDRDAKRQALDQAAVEVVTRLARTIEHNRTFIAKLQDELVGAGLQDFAHTTILVRA